MFKNFVTVTYRNVVKYKSYSLINIIGFALGISCFLLIFFFIRDELSFDTFHTKADRIYCVAEIYTQSGNVQYIANSSGPWGPALAEDYPRFGFSDSFDRADFGQLSGFCDLLFPSGTSTDREFDCRHQREKNQKNPHCWFAIPQIGHV